MGSLLDLIKTLFGPKAISSTLGTRTNVVRFPGGKLDRYLRESLNIEAASDNAALNVYRDMEQLVPYVSKMNDSERLIFEGNLGRLRNKLEAADLLPKQKVVKEGEVVGMESKEKITGEELKKLIEEQGTKYPPTTELGKLETAGKKLTKMAEEISPEFLAKQEAERQAMIARQYEGKGYAGGVFGPSGMYRAVARNFLLDEAAKGKIKLSPDTIKNLQERNYISGGQPLMYADPIRIMRYHYGDDVFEKIPLDKIPTGAPSEIRDVMSKVEATPIKTEAPKTPGGYLTPGEYKANIEELQKIEDAIKRRESRFADMTEEEIQNELQQYGSKRSAFEMALEQDYPEEYAKYKGPKEPEKKAKGGAMGLDYLTGMEPPKGGYATGGRIGFESGTVPRFVKFLIEKLSTEKLIDRALLEKASPKAIQDLYISKYGKLPSAEEIKEMVNKELQGKRSMETVNPKTGEVTTPKEPVTTAQRYSDDIIKAADEIYPSYDDPRIAADQIVDSYAQMKYGLEDQYGLSNKERMDLYRQAYDYVMDYNRGAIGKTATKFDISDEATAKALTDFARKNDPEGFKKIQKIVDDLNNKNALEQFDIKDRKPNASGGLNYLMGF